MVVFWNQFPAWKCVNHPRLTCVRARVEQEAVRLFADILGRNMAGPLVYGHIVEHLEDGGYKVEARRCKDDTRVPGSGKTLYVSQLEGSEQ